MVAGTVVARDRPHEQHRRAAAPARGATEPRRRSPSSTTRTFRLLAAVRRPPGQLAPGARGPGSPAAWPRGCRPTRRPRARATLAHLLALHAAELARRQGRLAARGGRGRGHPVRRAEAPSAGTSSSGWPSARRAHGLDSFALARAPRLRRPLSRGRRRPGPGAHLPRATRPPRPASSGWPRPATTRSTGTSGAPGAGSGSCSRASARRP